MQYQSHKFCVAPMMDWTDRHCRFFHRLMTRHAMLYTEMVTAQAVIRGQRERLLGFDAGEHPVGLQLGGADAAALAEAARIGAACGYDEINLNCGCPSDRVQEGRFGACLMAEPRLVAELFAAMQSAVDVPVTVKCRIGIDDQDAEEDLERFVSAVAAAGCRTFIVHARKAWLKGLSPKENREVPPLDYDRVQRLKARHSELEIVLNGGIGSCDEGVAQCCPHNDGFQPVGAVDVGALDGVMLGRAAYQRPFMLADVDRLFYAKDGVTLSRSDVLERLVPYAERHVADGGRLNSITRHILGLYHGRPGGRAFRRHLSENAVRDGAGAQVLREAIAIAEGVAARPRATAEQAGLSRS